MQKAKPWTGVRNHTAKLEPDEDEEGRSRLLHHSNIGKEIVGIVKVAGEHYPDPTANAGDPLGCGSIWLRANQ